MMLADVYLRNLDEVERGRENFRYTFPYQRQSAGFWMRLQAAMGILGIKASENAKSKQPP